MIAWGSHLFRTRYRQVGEWGQVDWREARRQSCEFAQALADVAEAQAWLEPLHQSEDVALGVAGWIPPATSGVADDQDFALSRRYFRLSLVLSFRSSFHGGGVRSSTTAQCTLSRSSSISGSCPVMSAPRVLSAGAGLNGLGLVFAPALPADREAVALQGRAERAGACDAPFAARPATAVAIPLSFTSHAKAQRRRREQEIGPMSRGSTPRGRQRTSGYDSRRRASRNIRGTAADATRRKQLPRRAAPGFWGRRKAASRRTCLIWPYRRGARDPELHDLPCDVQSARQSYGHGRRRTVPRG